MERPLEPKRQPERGFTFIEVLVVMGIITVLAGLSVVALQMMARQRPKLDTETRIRKLQVSVGNWQRRFERLPPSDARLISKVAGGAKSVKSLPNTTNEGIESLFQALYWETANVDVQLTDDDIGNTDDDELSEAVTGQGVKLFEIEDGWGSPLVYFIHTDYGRASESPPAYLNSRGEEVYPKPWRYEAEGRTGFAEPSGFQIFSMGSDGEPNTEDDIKSWQ